MIIMPGLFNCFATKPLVLYYKGINLVQKCAGDSASAHFPLVAWQSATEYTWTKVSGLAASPQGLIFSCVLGLLLP